MVKTVIFIGGTVRSGTTVFSLFLANMLNGVSLGEVYAMFDPKRDLNKEPKERTKLEKEICGIGRKVVYGKILKYYKGVEVLIDSSKNPNWIYEQSITLKKQGVKVVNILIYKEYSELFQSFSKRKSASQVPVVLRSYYGQYFSNTEKTYIFKYNEIFNENMVHGLLSTLGLKGNIEYFFNIKKHPNIGGSDTLGDNNYQINVIKRSHDFANVKIEDNGAKTLYAILTANDISKKKEQYTCSNFDLSIRQFGLNNYHLIRYKLFSRNLAK